MEIPNSISSANLASFLDDAPDDDTCNCADSGRLSQHEIEQLASGTLDAIMDDLDPADCPLVHKVMCLLAIRRFQAWHESIAEKAMKHGVDFDQVSPWLKDAGKLASVGYLLQAISIGEDDFTCLDL